MSGPISLDELRRKHVRARDAIRKAVDQAATEAGGDAVTFSREHHRYKSRTGALENATLARTVRLRSGAKVVLKNAKAYAASIDMGARPHVITPRRGKFLRFMSGGKIVFARRVQHPGNQAYRFLYNATRHGYRMLAKRLTERLASVARKF